MGTPQSVLIPLTLLSQTIDLLESWNIAEYDPAIQHDYERVYYAFLKKQQSLELRESYARIVYADNDAARHSARMDYLQQKRHLHDDF